MPRSPHSRARRPLTPHGRDPQESVTEDSTPLLLQGFQYRALIKYGFGPALLNQKPPLVVPSEMFIYSTTSLVRLSHSLSISPLSVTLESSVSLEMVEAQINTSASGCEQQVCQQPPP